MDYVELSISTVSEELAEIITAELAEYPFESFQTERQRGAVTLKSYIPQEALADCKDEVDQMLVSYNVENKRYISIETQNWNAQWESNFDPVEIEGKLLIRAPFHEADPSFNMEVVIMPKMSFGTGHHSTTHLMAEWIIDIANEGGVASRALLDMGSGTGVLAIVAAKCGAAAVDAVDIDEWADENCRENIGVNGVDQIVTPYLGDLSAVATKRYDIILANINRNILLANMKEFAAALNEGGELLISGFLEEDIEALRAAAQQHGMSPAGERVDGGWVAMRIKR